MIGHADECQCATCKAKPDYSPEWFRRTVIDARNVDAASDTPKYVSLPKMMSELEGAKHAAS